MTRREFVAFLCSTLAAWPLGLRSQPPGTVMPVVGVIGLELEDRLASVRDGLRDMGYVDGRNLRLEVRTVGDSYAGLLDAANDLVRRKVDVLVTLGNTATVAASKATSAIPIVMIAAVDPVKEKLAVSLSRPGGNVTGLTTIGQELVPKRFELVQQVIPGLARVGVLWHPESQGSRNSLVQTQEAARALKLQPVAARSVNDFDAAFETLAKSGTSVFVMMSSSMFEKNRRPLLDSAARHRLAGVYGAAHWAESGGLISYGPDVLASYRRAGYYVDRILKGAKPGELAIEQPTKFELVVNLKTAKTLGIKVPQGILARADRVIE